MNILVLTRCMVHPDNKAGGATNVVLFFAKEWVKQGHNVVMIHNISSFPAIYYKVPKSISGKFAGDGRIPTEAAKPLTREEDGVKIARMPMMKFIPHSGYLKFQYKNQEKKIIQYLKELNFVPDVITGHWLEPQLELVTSLSDYYNTKKALVIHGTLPARLSKDYQSKLTGLDKLFFRSESVLNSSLQKFSFLDKDKCGICYSGIPDQYLDNHIERNDWKESDILHLIYVGRLTAYKRIDATLNALAKAFPSKNFEFTIIGDGDEAEALKKIALELNISEQVVFTGRIPRDEVIDRMNHSDCFVMISENEVFGLVYLEAMCSGCITIASKCGGVDGIIVDGKNGYLCEQGDCDKLVKLLIKVNEMEKSQVLNMRDVAYKTVVDFTDSKVADKYLGEI